MSHWELADPHNFPSPPALLLLLLSFTFKTMKAQHLLLVVPVVEAYLTSTPSASFVGRVSSFSSVSSNGGLWKMDMEGDMMDTASRFNVEKLLQQKHTLNQFISPPPATVEEAQEQYGMPWQESIDPKADNLLYMPFWTWQMDFMKENLTNLKVKQCRPDFGYIENKKKKARMVNLEFSSDEYRKIRMTYYDAGDNTQVFNAVWYPDPKYNLPVLGIDLLAFNRKKYLAIVDFQPLYEEEGDHAATFEHLLQPIKEQYDSLKGRMSSKFYDETQFFSQQMLFARFDDEGVVDNDLRPAFEQYVQTHLDLLKNTKPDPSNAATVLERHAAYDTYSAERDPATGLFATMFGKEWADDFVFDFLFSLSERKEGGLTIMPPMGMGGPPPKQAGAPPSSGAAPASAQREPVVATR